DVNQDVPIMLGYTRRIRLYGTDNGLLGQVLTAVASNPQAEVYAGIWVDQNEKTYRGQLNTLLATARQMPTLFRRAVRVVSVGNEAVLTGMADEATMIQRIKETRAALRAIGQQVPVTTVEPMNRYSSAIADAVDVLFPTLHPYFDGVHIDGAVNKVFQLMQMVRDRDSTGRKPLIIAEVGWPSSGKINNQAQPSLANAQRFAHEFPSAANARSVDYFYFEAFDQSWKQPGSLGVEPYWGMLTEDRRTK
ncbi:glycoside hydrolase superfamily, partial [Thamnocephalis sphaerospora]